MTSQRQRPTRYLVIIGLLIILLVGVVIIEVGQLLPLQLGTKEHQSSTQPTNNSSSPPQLTALPTPQAGTILYQENGSDNWKGWSGTPDWKILNGVLINDGTYDTNAIPPTITAPYQVQTTPDYAVEVKMRIQRMVTGRSVTSGFAIAARGTSGGSTWKGYFATLFPPNSSDSVPTAYLQNNDPNFVASILARAPFDPGTSEHIYRFEVKGNDLKLLIDGSLKVETQDNQFLVGGQVGLLSYDEELSVSSFKIIAL
jgi:hypothetical protein